MVKWVDRRAAFAIDTTNHLLYLGLSNDVHAHPITVTGSTHGLIPSQSISPGAVTAQTLTSLVCFRNESFLPLVKNSSSCPPRSAAVLSRSKVKCTATCEISQIMNTCARHHHEPDHDPTLASCCQRDLAQQAQDRKCLQRLQAADRSNVRTEMFAAVLATPNDSDSQPGSSDLSCEDEAGETHTCDHRKRWSPWRMLTHC